MTSRYGRRALTAALSVFLLAGCAGSPAIGTSTADIQNVAHQQSSSGNCPAVQGGTGTLPDGDFSQAANPGLNFSDYHKGAVFAPSWKAAKGTIDFVGTGFWNMDGLCSVDLDGNTAGGIKTSAFPTEKGASYTVTFLLSGSGCEGSSGRHCSPEKKMEVAAASQFEVFTWDTAGYNDVEHGIYEQESWDFIAAKSLTILKFVSQDAKSSGRGEVVAAIAVSKE